jgi:hypothetical protein
MVIGKSLFAWRAKIIVPGPSAPRRLNYPPGAAENRRDKKQISGGIVKGLVQHDNYCKSVKIWQSIVNTLKWPVICN